MFRKRTSTSEAIPIRGGQFTTDVRLDRVRRVDLRDLGYPAIDDAIGVVNRDKPRTRMWPLVVYNDQGQEGACVGFGWGHEAAASPVAVRDVDAAFSRERIYWAAQRQDRWEGGAYPDASPFYEGTEVRAGAQVMVDLGLADEYRWLFSVQEIVLYLGWYGPVVIGVDWYEGMFNADASGFIKPTGNIAGGHCAVLVGVRLVRLRKNRALAWDNIDWLASHVILHNSWGQGWGQGGRAKIALIDLATLVPGGDFCVLVRRHRKPR